MVVVKIGHELRYVLDPLYISDSLREKYVKAPRPFLKWWWYVVWFYSLQTEYLLPLIIAFRDVDFTAPSSTISNPPICSQRDPAVPMKHSWLLPYM